MHELPEGYRVPPDDDALHAECDETVFQASGPGGQHRNRTRSAVRLFHRPSGWILIGRRDRSQHRNRADALRRLRARLEEALTPRRKRIQTKATRAAKQRRLEAKRRRAEVKRARERPRADD